MTRCRACGLRSLGDLCHFCQETARLIKGRLCVSCKAPVDDDSRTVQGRCAECRSRQVAVSFATTYLLGLAAKARYRASVA